MGGAGKASLFSSAQPPHPGFQFSPRGTDPRRINNSAYWRCKRARKGATRESKHWAFLTSGQTCNAQRKAWLSHDSSPAL